MERSLRKILLALGIVAVLGGLLWLCLPDAPSPRTGGLVAVLGAVMLWLGRRAD